VLVKEPEQVTRGVAQRRAGSGGPDARHHRHRVMPDEVRRVPLLLQELAVRRQVVGVGSFEVLARAAVEPHDLEQHAGVLTAQQPTRLCQQATCTAATGELQSAVLAADAHAHLGRSRVDSELGEQTSQQGVGPVVVHDEAGVDDVPTAVRRGDVVAVRVTAEPVVGLEQRHVVRPPQQVGRGEPGDAGAHDRDRGPGSAALRRSPHRRRPAAGNDDAHNSAQPAAAPTAFALLRAPGDPMPKPTTSPTSQATRAATARCSAGPAGASSIDAPETTSRIPIVRAVRRARGDGCVSVSRPAGLVSNRGRTATAAP
jgi:hypothetical protein